jgi:peptidoglycan/xylan/chitin deacetylase (PgdA/CDA1 family)
MFKARQQVRYAAATAFYGSGGFHALIRRRAKQGQICILGLHRVLTEEQIQRSCSEPAIILKRSTFADLCAFLSEQFEVVSLGSVLQPAADGFTPQAGEKPRCVITFDDGWADNYENALAVLQRFRFPATIFLATAMMDSASAFWVERVRASAADPARWREVQRRAQNRIGKREVEISLRDVTEYLKCMSSEQRAQLIEDWIGELPDAGSSDRMLTWYQVREMARAGVDFGSHTRTHPLLPYESANQAAAELGESKQDLQKHAPGGAGGFAYPNGAWNQWVRSEVQNAGYACAVTTQPGWLRLGSDLYSIPRVLLHEGNVTSPDGRFSPSATALTLVGWR